MKVLGQDIMSMELGLAGSIPDPKFAFWSTAKLSKVIGGIKWLKSMGSFGFPSAERFKRLPPAWAPKMGKNSEASLVGVPGLPGMKVSGIRATGMWRAAFTANVGFDGKETKYGCAGSGETGKGAGAGEPELSEEEIATDEVEVSDEFDNSPELFPFFGR